MISVYRRVTPERAGEFLACGYDKSHFFPHRYYYFPKCGPDGYKLAQRMVGPCAVDALREVVLYAEGPLLDEFPAELFLDNEVVWHQQHFGRVGQVATANLVLKDNILYSMGHVSDVVQRISRRREFKTRIEKRFQGWASMLLNAVLNYAMERDIPTLLTPTSDLALLNTDRKRNPKLEMFHDIYDKTVLRLVDASPRRGWWQIDVARNRNRIVTPEMASDQQADERTICVCHDIERGLGHTDVDPAFATFADAHSSSHLQEMLAVEWDEGVKATYCIVGSLLTQERGSIELGGHSLAFHSFDHKTCMDGKEPDQLIKCRSVDYRIKGYRPPQSKLTPDLTNENLLTHNFEWIASSRYSLGIHEPMMASGLVRIPIAFDDFPLYKEGMAFENWERLALDYIKSNRFVALGLHDCYAQHWLPKYRAFVRRLKECGYLRTLDQVASMITFSNAQ